MSKHTPESIVGEVACLTGIPVAAIIGRRRTQQVVYARFLSIAAVRREFDWWTLCETGEFFRRDHGSICNAMLRHRDLLETIPWYLRTWQQLIRTL